MVFPFAHIGGSNLLLSALMVGCRCICVESFDPLATVDFLAEEGSDAGRSGNRFPLGVPGGAAAHAGPADFSARACLPGRWRPETGPPALRNQSRTGWGRDRVRPRPHRVPDRRHVRHGRSRRQVGDDRGTAGPGRTGQGGQFGRTPLRPQRGGRATPDRAANVPWATSMRASMPKRSIPDGYFRTGDLGFFDEDGYVHVVGRLKDVINRKGENISAKEIEDELYHHPGIREVAVIGATGPGVGGTLLRGDRPVRPWQTPRHGRSAGISGQPWSDAPKVAGTAGVRERVAASPCRQGPQARAEEALCSAAVGRRPMKAPLSLSVGPAGCPAGAGTGHR